MSLDLLILMETSCHVKKTFSKPLGESHKMKNAGLLKLAIDGLSRHMSEQLENKSSVPAYSSIFSLGQHLDSVFNQKPRLLNLAVSES